MNRPIRWALKRSAARAPRIEPQPPCQQDTDQFMWWPRPRRRTCRHKSKNDMHWKHFLVFFWFQALPQCVAKVVTVLGLKLVLFCLVLFTHNAITQRIPAKLGASFVGLFIPTTQWPLCNALPKCSQFTWIVTVRSGTQDGKVIWRLCMPRIEPRILRHRLVFLPLGHGQLYRDLIQLTVAKR